jgi:hypothetical protein
MKKKGVLQLALQFTVYTMQLITTQLQLNQNNSFSITMQLYYNYTHDVMDCHPSIENCHVAL